MVKRAIIFLLALVLPAITSGQQVPATLGWFDFTNTTLNASSGVICPTYADIVASGSCNNVMVAWGGGLADTKRNRMVIWGGGHVDYHGNEVYGVNLSVNPATRQLLRDASHGANLAVCGGNIETNPDGTPTSRHTYDGELYDPVGDSYFFIGGSEMCNGGFSTSVWKLNPTTFAWTNTGITLPNGGNGGPFPMADYDPVNKLFYQYDNNLPEFYTINPANNVVTNLSTGFSGTVCTSGAGGGNLYTAAIDPVRRIFICNGTAGSWKISLNSPFTATQLAMTGCAASSSAPGFAYYPVRKDFVEWAGGNTVFFYNPDTDSCTSQTFSGGPGAQQVEGTYGRFRYFPQLGYFILGNSMTQDFFALRLDTPSDTNFNFRSTQSGVLNAQGFDTSAIFATTVNTTTPTDGFGNSPTWVRDTTNFLSGGASAHCPITANFSGDNPCSDYWAMFGQGAGLQNFGINSTFYVQFAFRADASWINTNWTNFGPPGDNTAPKIVIFDNIQNSCDVTEITTHYHDALIPASYTDCGGLSVTSTNGTTWDNNGDFWQQGWLAAAPFTGYQCSFSSGFTGPNCFKPVANQWYTFYYKITIGPSWTTASSSIEAWVAPYGQQMKKLESVTNFNFGGNDFACNAAGTGTGSSQCAFNNLHITQFMTAHGIGPGGSPAANVWYDELLISSQPICPPGGASPDGLSACPSGVASAPSPVVTPTFNIPAGTYSSAQNVTISTTTGGATLCYTTDGSTPTANGAGTCTHGTTYSTPVAVSSNLTLKAIGSESGFTDSALASAPYIISPPGPSGVIFGAVVVQGGAVVVN